MRRRYLKSKQAEFQEIDDHYTRFATQHSDYYWLIQDANEANQKNLHKATYLLAPKRPTTLYDIAILKTIPITNFLAGEPQFKANNRAFYKSPFRNERTGSLCVYLDTNTYCDFGDQSHAGDNISFIMELNKLSFREACEYLSKYC